jgi:hypothetical protein
LPLLSIVLFFSFGVLIFSTSLTLVNKNLHWSLCVIVNPGEIMNGVKWADKENRPDFEEMADQPYPCILFFDSLHAHRKSTVANHLRKWLNSEWKRLRSSDGAQPGWPFTASTMPIFDPKGAFARVGSSIRQLFSSTIIVSDAT